MKNHRFLLQSIVFAAAALGASQAMAQSTATVTLNGQVAAGTCSVSSPTINMGPIRLDEVPNFSLPTGSGASTVGAGQFNLAFTGCAGVTSASITFGTAADAGQSNTFKPSTGANTNLTFWVKRGLPTCGSHGTGTTVVPGTAFPQAVSGASATVNLCAFYWKANTGVAGKGSLSKAITVNITYS